MGIDEEEGKRREIRTRIKVRRVGIWRRGVKLG